MKDGELCVCYLQGVLETNQPKVSRHLAYLRKVGLVESRREGNCYDNATMESFWSTLKHELVYRCRFASRAEARQCLFEWIEVFYNRTRLHSSLGNKSPVDFENQLN